MSRAEIYLVAASLIFNAIAAGWLFGPALMAVMEGYIS